ncbi:hypothetical protein T4C_8335 [Trichinella pseudospiralis]|uniref:Uncharacterized protein n=1 Tax=Trichinella pseudospiralis TaxID=6337 RepID=A0A0V1I0J7_TRIPS|nr:hypothetical protein T4C_8335 [Trichinella pseudospiralis]
MFIHRQLFSFYKISREIRNFGRRISRDVFN